MDFQIAAQDFRRGSAPVPFEFHRPVHQLFQLDFTLEYIDTLCQLKFDFFGSQFLQIITIYQTPYTAQINVSVLVATSLCWLSPGYKKRPILSFLFSDRRLTPFRQTGKALTRY